MSQNKPGLSNEEFCKRQRIEIDLNLGLDISYKRELTECLDRLEALETSEAPYSKNWYKSQLEGVGEKMQKQVEAIEELKAKLCGQGKPTPGQIGLVDGDKLIEKLTIESALTRETPEGKGWIEAMNAVKYWTRLGDFSVTGQGQEERDYVPDDPGLGKNSFMRFMKPVKKCLTCDGKGWVIRYPGGRKKCMECNGCGCVDASADKAQDGKG